MSKTGESHNVAGRRNAHLCLHCGRGFARKEHLLRHERIHTQDTPFECSACKQRFKRKDVYSRHVNNFCRARMSNLDTASITRERRRTVRACDRCRVHKLKCDGQASCWRCLQKAETCVYSQSRPGLTMSTTANTLPMGLLSTTNEFATVHLPIVSHADGPSAAPMTIASSMHAEIGPGADISSFTGTIHARQQADTEPLMSTNFEPHELFLPDQYATEHEQPTSANWGSSITLQDLNTWHGQWPDGWFDDAGSATLDEEHLHLFPMNPEIDLGSFEPFDVTAANDGWADQTNRSRLLQQYPQPPQIQTLGLVTSSSESTSPSWITSLKRSIQHYDRKVVNYFLNKFMGFVSASFPIFEKLEIISTTLPDVILSMAAVGGLLCKFEGSFLMARSMYTDARRLVFTRAYCEEHVNAPQALQIVQTVCYNPWESRMTIFLLLQYICLELFGLCSGDVRSFESTEALHMQLLENAEQFNLLRSGHSKGEDWEQSRLKLLHSLSTLESYRVTLLQRPPVYYAASNLHPDSWVHFSPSLANQRLGTLGNMDASNDLLGTLLSPNLWYSKPVTYHESIFCLTTLITLSWHTNSRTSSKTPSRPLLKRDFIELGFHRWLGLSEASDVKLDLAAMQMFHVAFINMRVDVRLLHRFVRVYIKDRLNMNEIHSTIKIWQDSEDAKVAVLHASEMLQIARSSVASECSMPRVHQQLNQSSSQEHLAPDAPHVAVCIYIAAITLWAANGVGVAAKQELGWKSLDQGIYLLSRLVVRMASELCNVLKCLRMSITEADVHNG